MNNELIRLSDLPKEQRESDDDETEAHQRQASS